LAAGVLRRDLRGIGRRFARALEALAARRRPGDGVALGVGDGDHGVVERRVDVRDARGDVLALAALDAAGGCGRCWLGHRALYLFLAGDRPGAALAGARVGVCALAADRQALAVAQAAIAAEIHEPLDVHADLAP